jgi:hypothetical protein
MMSLDKPNVDKISSWDAPGGDLNPRDRKERDALRNALDHCVTANLRHRGVLIPETDSVPKDADPFAKSTWTPAGGIYLARLRGTSRATGWKMNGAIRQRQLRKGQDIQVCAYPFGPAAVGHHPQ